MSLLVTVLVLPLVGAFTIFFISSWNRPAIKVIALTVSLINFLLSLLLWLFFDNSAQKFQYLEIDRGSIENEGLIYTISENSSELAKSNEVEINSITSNLLVNSAENQNLSGELLVRADSTLSFVLGLDGISLFFVILTTFLIPVCLLEIGRAHV